jgi:uncharacterized membrane protein HdeD (DUF308 family)
MATVIPDPTDMQRAIKDALGTHWKLFMFQAVVMIILGVLAVGAPVVATITIDYFVGWLFLISGVIGLIALFSAHDIPAFLWTLVTAALSIAASVLLLSRPVVGALSLTLVLVALFVAEGVFQIAASLGYRHAMASTWGWLLVSGIADLLLAAVIIIGWPMTALWALGLLVGINLITSGFAIMMAALAGRDVAKG